MKTEKSLVVTTQNIDKIFEEIKKKTRIAPLSLFVVPKQLLYQINRKTYKGRGRPRIEDYEIRGGWMNKF